MCAGSCLSFRSWRLLISKSGLSAPDASCDVWIQPGTGACSDRVKARPCRKRSAQADQSRRTARCNEWPGHPGRLFVSSPRSVIKTTDMDFRSVGPTDILGRDAVRPRWRRSFRPQWVTVVSGAPNRRQLNGLAEQTKSRKKADDGN